MDLKNISLSANHGTYILSPNKNFSIFFEVCTAAVPVNVSYDTFSKTAMVLFTIKIPSSIIQQPMMSRVW